MPEREAHQALPAELEAEPLAALRHLPSEGEYPESDGQPMADNAFQGRAIVGLGTALRLRFRDRDDVLVDCDMLVYYQRNEPAKCVAPDVFVVRGVLSDARRVYKVWKERPLDFVLEVASPRTVGADRKEKRDLYARIGVREYFQYDPQGGLLAPRLQGRRLRWDGSYEVLPGRRREGVERSVRSEVLGLEFHFDGRHLRVWDPIRQRYLSAEDAEDRADEARAWGSAESARADAEAARADMEATRADEAEARAAAEAERANAAIARAKAEAEERKRLEAKVARLTAARQSANS